MASKLSDYRARRQMMIDYLGGECVECGGIDLLQFDHVDPSTKSFDVSKNWAIAWDVLNAELNKCQLLCKPHHLEKSQRNKELKGGQNKLDECPHGTVWGYAGRWKCRCDACKAAKSKYEKQRIPR